MRTYRRRLSFTAGTDDAETDPRLDLEVCLNASLAIIDEHLDAWLTEHPPPA